MITHVLIDVDNTLLDFNKCGKQSIINSFNEIGMSCKDDFFDHFKEVNDSLWLKIETGELTKEQLYETRFRLVFDKTGIDADSIDFERRFRENLAKSCVLVEGADEILAYLAKKYILCTASNGPQKQQCIRLHKAGLLQYFTHVFTSEQIGFSKPDERFFKQCLFMADIRKAERCMMIGDSITADIEGGKRVGMKTCLFNFSGLCDVNVADYTVNKLVEIKNIL